MSDAFLYENWEQVFQPFNDINETWNRWKLQFFQEIKSFIPHRTVTNSLKHRAAPWFTKDLKKLIRVKNRLFKKAYQEQTTITAILSCRYGPHEKSWKNPGQVLTAGCGETPGRARTFISDQSKEVSQDRERRRKLHRCIQNCLRPQGLKAFLPKLFNLASSSLGPISTNEPSLESLKSQQSDGAILIPVSPRKRTIAPFLREGTHTFGSISPNPYMQRPDQFVLRGEIAVHSETYRSARNKARCNLSRWWSIARDLCGFKSQRHSSVSPLLDQSKDLLLDDKEKANLLNDVFINQNTSLALEAFPFMPSPLQETFDIDRISPKEVAETLRSLPIKSSCGSDEISYRLMKEAGPALVGPLVTLFNRSLLLRQVPDEWKKAIVIPIFKGGRKDRQEPSSYRPISLTSCVAQTMEKIVNAKILNFFKTNTFLYPLQSGFLPTHSTVTQLAYLVHKWQMALDRGESIESVFLVRLSKAHGRVSHQGLISKLSTCSYKNSHEFLNSNENLMRFSWHSHEIFPILMRISHEVFCSWESHFSHENWKLIRISWDSHEKIDILMRFSHELFYWWESHFSHERWKLMRVSWDSHEILMRKPSHENFVSAFSHDCIV